VDLQTMFQLVHQKSYYSRTDQEVWNAISEAASTLFLKILSENRGFFLKFDTSTVALTLGTEEYLLPIDCTQLLRVRERASSSAPWRVVTPADLNDPDFTDSQFASALGPNMDGPVSQFTYYSYLDAAQAAGAQTEKIRFEPPPYDARQIELVYVAKFVDITKATSTMVIPAEGHGAVLWSAVSSLLDDNGDDGEKAQANSAENEREFLKWVRKRQMQTAVTKVQPYLDDLD
jgi:hypothetical protein